MTVPQPLIDAYNSAEYHVSSYQPFVLSVNQFNRNLRNLHDEHHVESSAFLTAHNPFSQLVTDYENTILQNSLKSDIDSLGFTFINGFGQSSEYNKNWKESSFLVLGINFEMATALAKKYNQNAYIWSASECIPKLIICV